MIESQPIFTQKLFKLAIIRQHVTQKLKIVFQSN